MSAYYVAAFTDSGCIHACDHRHVTVTAAAACISSAGGYVIAMQDESPRALSDSEEAEFQHAMYGKSSTGEVETSPAALHWAKVVIGP
jgi:hypothetical protein